jgi:hypothetical protein
LKLASNVLKLVKFVGLPACKKKMWPTWHAVFGWILTVRQSVTWHQVAWRVTVSFPRRYVSCVPMFVKLALMSVNSIIMIIASNVLKPAKVVQPSAGKWQLKFAVSKEPISA